MLALMIRGLAAALLAGAFFSGPAPILAAEGDMPADAEKLRKELAAERARTSQLDDQRKILLAQVEKLRDELEATRKTIGVLKEQVARLQMDIEDCRKDKMDLARQLAALPAEQGPAIHTRIKAVQAGDQVTLVTVEVGEDKRVRPDFCLLIHRDAEYLGKVRILKTEKTSCVGVVIDGRKPVREGDWVISPTAPFRERQEVKPPEPPPTAPRPTPGGDKKAPEVF